MSVDAKIVENLVEVITREVLLALSEQEARHLQPDIDLCKLECANHICVSTCFDKVGQVINAGAQRISLSPGDGPVAASLASLIDHTLLKPDATPEQIDQLCQEARQNNFATVCVNPINVKKCAELLKGSPVKVCSVVGFPLGATYPDIKVLETQFVLQDGASEIDMVINIGALKGGDLELVARDIRGVVKVAHEAGALVKVIIEAALLTDEEKIIACLLAKEAGADYVKTSTGFAGGGATVHDVELMRRAVGASMGVKAAGGIKTREDAISMIRAGATRIGASAGVKIVRGDNGSTSPSINQPKSY